MDKISIIDILLILLLLLLPIYVNGFPKHGVFGEKLEERASDSDECCVSSKLNVASKKSNNGREFFRQLSSSADSYKEINPENMCNLVHFFIQQAALNNQSISFTKGTKKSSLRIHSIRSLFRHVRSIRFDQWHFQSIYESKR